MNIFIRTSIAPYRVDTYNALHEKLDMKMCFYNRTGRGQHFNIDSLESKCSFRPVYLKGVTIGQRDSRKICFGIWRLLRKERPGIVIVPEFQFCAFQVLLYRKLSRRKFKVVSMTDDSYDMIAGNDFTKLHGKLRNLLPKYFDELLVVTPEVRQWYHEHYCKGIWLPIMMDDEKASSYYASLLPKSRKNIDKYHLCGKKVILFVGRLVNLKNLPRVLDAFAKSGSDAVMVIIGDGPERGDLEKRAASIRKEVLFTGRLDSDELYAWYNISCVLILASLQEAFGAVTNEALLAGSRVIVSEKAGSSCLVNKTNGQIINPFEVDEIARAIDSQLRECDVPDLKSVRQSLMTVSFKERIDNMVQQLK